MNANRRPVSRRGYEIYPRELQPPSALCGICGVEVLEPEMLAKDHEMNVEMCWHCMRGVRVVEDALWMHGMTRVVTAAQRTFRWNPLGYLLKRRKKKP